MPRASLRLTLLVVAGLALGGAVFAASSWPPGLTLRHVAAASNCAMARTVRLAPAYWGEPGYYARHDADGDGIACEPYRGARSSRRGFRIRPLGSWR